MACNDWLRMGAGRSLKELVNAYQQTATIKRSFKPPTLSYETLRTWASRFDWPERASSYDAEFEAIKNEERSQVFNQALALDFGRVRKLVNLAHFLEAQIYEQSEPDEDGTTSFLNIWVNDVKQIGKGEEIERIDIVRFNSALISEYRATLGDIAKEVGGRVAKQDVSGTIETRNTNTNVNIPAENAHDAGNILTELAKLGAIPPARSEGGHDPAPE